LPRSGGRVDEKKAAALVRSAIERGVNYVDTAYLYLGNEAAVGNILSGGYRDKVFLSTKLPPVQITSRKDMDKILATQLERLQTDHIDYYLMHNIMSVEAWERLKSLGVLDFLEKAKADGRIRHTAFSSHGPKDQFKTLVDDYPWDMAQIQYNYMDENNQAGKEGLLYAAEKGLGIVIMEPLRGGFLVNKLPPEVTDIFGRAPVRRTPAEWGLRWVWNHPEVSLVLSGMNAEAQLEENLRIAGDMTPIVSPLFSFFALIIARRPPSPFFGRASDISPSCPSGAGAKPEQPVVKNDRFYKPQTIITCSAPPLEVLSRTIAFLGFVGHKISSARLRAAAMP
jgi:predicted aldo/keto reductase-like oxidoreductase